MAIELAPRTRPRARLRRRHHLAQRVRYQLSGAPIGTAPPLLPPWRVQSILFELRDWGSLERERDLARLEVKSWRQLAARYEAERDAAQRALKILAQQALEREWLIEGEPA